MTYFRPYQDKKDENYLAIVRSTYFMSESRLVEVLPIIKPNVSGGKHVNRIQI
jgi:hypothetical protein